MSAKVIERPKLYVIRKYVMARSVIEAVRLEKKAPAHTIDIDEAWKEKNLAEAVGFAPKQGA